MSLTLDSKAPTTPRGSLRCVGDHLTVNRKGILRPVPFSNIFVNYAFSGTRGHTPSDAGRGPNYPLFVRCITKFCIFFPFLNFALEVQNNRYFIDNRLMVGQKLTGVGPVKREREREVKPPPSRILEFSQG